MQDSIKVCLFLGTDAITAHFALRNRLKIQLVNQFVRGQVVRKIRLVAENQEGNAIQRWSLQQKM